MTSVAPWDTTLPSNMSSSLAPEAQWRAPRHNDEDIAASNLQLVWEALLGDALLKAYPHKPRCRLDTGEALCPPLFPCNFLNPAERLEGDLHRFVGHVERDPVKLHTDVRVVWVYDEAALVLDAELLSVDQALLSVRRLQRDDPQMIHLVCSEGFNVPHHTQTLHFSPEIAYLVWPPGDVAMQQHRIPYYNS